MPWAAHPAGDSDPELQVVTDILDPVLVPLGFAPGQVGPTGRRSQVIFCRGDVGLPQDGCVDLVIDVEARPEWQIIDVRYSGFPSESWHLDFDRHGGLSQQLDDLADSLPRVLA